MTLHLIDDGVDSRPILSQEKYDVSPFGTVRSLQRKSDALERDMLRNFLRNPSLMLSRAEPQDHSQATRIHCTYISR